MPMTKNKPKKIKLHSFICMGCLSFVQSSDPHKATCHDCQKNPQKSFDKRMKNIVDLG